MIVVDGAVDLPEALVAAGEVRVVPTPVWLGEMPFDGDPPALADLLRAQPAALRTSAPTVSALADAYRASGPVLALHVAAELSRTVARAREAAQRVGNPVSVIDSGSLSTGTGLLALEAWAMERHALRAPEIETRTRFLVRRLHTFGVVADPSWLARGQRVPLTPGQLRPARPLVLAVQERAVILDQPRDRPGALRQLAAHAQACRTTASGAIWALGHGQPGDLEQVVGQLAATLGGPPVFVCPLGPPVLAHLGPDALVLALLDVQSALGPRELRRPA